MKKTSPKKLTLESVVGSVKPLSPSEDFKAISREARDEKIRREARKLGYPRSTKV